jgi:hypothetical protein
VFSFNFNFSYIFVSFCNSCPWHLLGFISFIKSLLWII